MKTPTTALQRKLTKRGKYGLGVTLDKRFLTRHGLEAGDTVSIFEHPSRADVLCIQVARKATKPKPKTVYARTRKDTDKTKPTKGTKRHGCCGPK